MTPQLLAAEMADLEMRAVAAAEAAWAPGDGTSWEIDQAAYLERIDTVHRVFHADDPEAPAAPTPIRPQKASAGRRRRHQKQLPFKLGQLLPGAVTVLVTPLTYAVSPDGPDHAFRVLAYNRAGLQIRPAVGGTPRVVALLQGAYPTADWALCQTWSAATNTLAVQVPGRPSWLAAS